MAKPQPVAETSEQASLRRIGEGVRAKLMARGALDVALHAAEEAKARAKQAKSAYNRIVADLDEIERGETADYPLFPRGESKSKAASANPDGPGGGVPVEKGQTFLMAIPGMPEAAWIVLGAAGVTTVNGFLAAGEILGIADMTPELAAEAKSAVDKYLRGETK